MSVGQKGKTWDPSLSTEDRRGATDTSSLSLPAILRRRRARTERKKGGGRRGGRRRSLAATRCAPLRPPIAVEAHPRRPTIAGLPASYLPAHLADRRALLHLLPSPFGLVGDGRHGVSAASTCAEGRQRQRPRQPPRSLAPTRW